MQNSLFPKETVGSVSDLCRSAQEQIASYKEQRRVLDRKYPCRQERILLKLAADERHAFVNGTWRSIEMQSSARSLGQLSTAFAVSSAQKTGNPRVDTERRRSIQNQGTILTDLGAVPLARGISRSLLNQDLERIDEQRRAVISEGVGQTQQSLYQCELSRLDEIHASHLAQLDQEFEDIKFWLNRSMKV